MFAGVVMISIGIAIAGIISIFTLLGPLSDPDMIGGAFEDETPELLPDAPFPAFQQDTNDTSDGEGLFGGKSIEEAIGFNFDMQLVSYFIALGIMSLFSVLVGLPFFQLGAKASSIKVTRKLDKPKAFAGDYLLIEVTVKNRSLSRLPSLEIYDAYPEVFELALGENFIRTSLGPKAEVKFAYIVQIPIRGVFKIGPAKVIMRDQMGFYADEGLVDSLTEILVYPSYEDVRKMESIGKKRQLGLLFGAHKTKIKGMGTDFFGIRQYTAGDPFKFVDWKASARSGKMEFGELMVREFESEQNIRVVLFVDSGATMAGGLPRNNKLEYAIRSTVLLAHLGWEKKDMVGLVVYSDKVHEYIEPTGNRGQFLVFLEALARVEPKGRSNLEAAVEFVNRRLTRASFFVFLSDLEGDPRRVFEAVKYARARKHRVSIIAPFGPWFEIASYELSPIDRLIGEAITENLLKKRRILFNKLRNYEVSPVSVGPDDFLPTVMAEFNRAKRAGQ